MPRVPILVYAKLGLVDDAFVDIIVGGYVGYKKEYTT